MLKNCDKIKKASGDCGQIKCSLWIQNLRSFSFEIYKKNGFNPRGVALAPVHQLKYSNHKHKLLALTR